MDSATDWSAADRALLIQPPGLTSAKELLRIATTPQQQPTAVLPAGAAMGGPADIRADGQAGVNWGTKSFLLVWADTAEPVRLTPSVLLAHLILCSRRVSRCSVCGSLPSLSMSWFSIMCFCLLCIYWVFSPSASLCIHSVVMAFSWPFLKLLCSDARKTAFCWK